MSENVENVEVVDETPKKAVKTYEQSEVDYLTNAVKETAKKNALKEYGLTPEKIEEYRKLEEQQKTEQERFEEEKQRLASEKAQLEQERLTLTESKKKAEILAEMAKVGAVLDAVDYVYTLVGDGAVADEVAKIVDNNQFLVPKRDFGHVQKEKNEKVDLVSGAVAYAKKRG